MKIAIVGAGVAGLSCAHELQRCGINPVIYERNSFIGEQVSHVGAILQIAHRPIKDALQYIDKQFGIVLEPLNMVKNLVHCGPSKMTVIKGEFGSFHKRGKDKDSLKNQLYAQLKNPQVIFNEQPDIDILSRDYDYVVVSTGNVSLTKELGCWTKQLFQGMVRGAVVLGDFDPTALVMYINKDYCKSGYAYLTPFNQKKAFVGLIVPDITEKELDNYWEIFRRGADIDQYTVIEEFQLEHISGWVYPLQTRNIIFTGNAGGGIDPFLGFGQLNCIIMGVMAARSLVKGSDYRKLIKDILRRNKQMYEFRKGFDQLDNDGLDVLISSIGIPGLKHTMYYAPLDIIKVGSYLLKAETKLTRK